MSLLRFENNFLSISCVRFASKNNFLIVGHVSFALNTVFLLSTCSLRFENDFFFYLLCSLRFENNLVTIKGVRFASISQKTPFAKLSFAFVSLELPLLLSTVIWKFPKYDFKFFLKVTSMLLYVSASTANAEASMKD
jgi:hypothetical protein